MRHWPALLILCLPAMAAEKAAYDSNGRIIAMLSDGEDTLVASNVVAVMPGGKRVPLQIRRGGGGASRQGSALFWTSPFELPDGGRGRLELKSEEDSAGVRYAVNLTAQNPLNVSAVEFVLDLPRPVFVNGTGRVEGTPPFRLAAVRAAGPVLFQGSTAALDLQARDTALSVAFDQPHAATVFDRWETSGRSFQVRTVLAQESVAGGATASLVTTLRLTNTAATQPPVKLTLDTSRTSFHFDGFGGNYCWNNASPAAAYTLNNLKLAWARSEMKVIQWDKERDHPGPTIRADMETMKRFQEMGVPFVISIWWLPERFYTDPFEKPSSAHFRTGR